MEEATLTKRQVQILEFVREHRRRLGYSPTMREIAGEFELSSVATVAEHLDSLEEKGLIRRERDRARSMLLTARGRSLLAGRGRALRGREAAGTRLVTIPLLGTIAAGEPIEAVAVREDLDVPAGMAGRGKCYALRVRGLSMVDEGIFDGDYVVVEEKPSPENGETVVALIGGEEATLKKFYRERRRGRERIRLEPANPEMKPILLGEKDHVEIQGRVRGVLRLL